MIGANDGRNHTQIKPADFHISVKPVSIELECPFCKNEKIGIVLSKRQGVPSGDNGWCAEIKCRCGASMKVWALKRSWAEETIKRKWNRRAGEEDKHEQTD